MRDRSKYTQAGSAPKNVRRPSIERSSGFAKPPTWGWCEKAERRNVVSAPGYFS